MLNEKRKKFWRSDRRSPDLKKKAKEEGTPEGQVPTHVAIIMDGNGRWAISRGLPRLAGHQAGTDNLRRVIEACVEFGIKYLTIYAFSTENWGRPQEEVRAFNYDISAVSTSSRLRCVKRCSTRLSSPSITVA